VSTTRPGRISTAPLACTAIWQRLTTTRSPRNWPARCTCDSASWPDADESLRAVEQAVDLLRELAAREPECFQSDLAASLNGLALRLQDDEQYERAKEISAEAVHVSVQLLSQCQDAYHRDHATVMNTRSSILADLGEFDEALTAIEEAVRVRRELVQQSPDTYRHYLAKSLEDQAQQRWE